MAMSENFLRTRLVKKGEKETLFDVLAFLDRE